MAGFVRNTHLQYWVSVLELRRGVNRAGVQSRPGEVPEDKEPKQSSW